MESLNPWFSVDYVRCVWSNVPVKHKKSLNCSKNTCEENKACKMGIEAVCEKAANGSFGGLFPLREEERMSKLLKVLLAEERNQVSGGFGRQISEWPKFCGTGI